MKNKIEDFVIKVFNSPFQNHWLEDKQGNYIAKYIEGDFFIEEGLAFTIPYFKEANSKDLPFIQHPIHVLKYDKGGVGGEGELDIDGQTIKIYTTMRTKIEECIKELDIHFDFPSTQSTPSPIKDAVEVSLKQFPVEVRKHPEKSFICLKNNDSIFSYNNNKIYFYGQLLFTLEPRGRIIQHKIDIFEGINGKDLKAILNCYNQLQNYDKYFLIQRPTDISKPFWSMCPITEDIKVTELNEKYYKKLLKIHGKNVFIIHEEGDTEYYYSVLIKSISKELAITKAEMIHHT